MRLDSGKKFEYFVRKEIGKHVARDLESMLDGSWEIGLRCNNLLVEFQSFDEEEQMSDELKSCLAWIMDEWYALAVRNGGPEKQNEFGARLSWDDFD